MTAPALSPRERWLHVIAGQPVDVRPVLAWPNSGGGVAVSTEKPSDSDLLWLVPVANPFARSVRAGQDLNALLKADPVNGNEGLDARVEETRRAIQSAFHAGADGILYYLVGASAQFCSPMQYGGYYLERDRELLETASNGVANVLMVHGGADAYLDFVSDLPAHVFAWDASDAGFTAAQVRAMRQGVQASADAESEIFWSAPETDLPSLLETLA
jgi:hypothetical protein